MLPAHIGDLAERIVTFRDTEDAIQNRLARIRGHLLATSRHIREANFTHIHVDDLAHLFDSYDRHFLGGRVRSALGRHRLTFRLAPRLTRSGGVTKRSRWRNGEVNFEIAVGTSILFEGFADGDRAITACGLVCASRLDALQRIFEHELVHLIEMLCWENSACAAPRFQEIAQRFFLHREHTHGLITRRERAADSGIRPGVPVAFPFEGRRLTGVVNRVTSRITVLVEDAAGRRYSDGRRYAKYYVPLDVLTPVTPAGDPPVRQ